MAPEVFYSVCYGSSDPPDAFKSLHTLTPAVLHGYCRHRVKGADYPGVIAEEGHSVRGVFATGLTDANMDKLDRFEGSEYKRENVKVKLLEKIDGEDVEGDEKDVIAYVFLYPEFLERVEWDFAEFRRDKLKQWARGDWQDEQGEEEPTAPPTPYVIDTLHDDISHLQQLTSFQTRTTGQL